MAESLRRLVNIGSFGILQEKLEKWLDDYHIISCDQNVARCCEIVELNARVQGQLFKLLSICASEGGMYGGASVLRSRLLPWLGQGFFAAGGSVTADTSLSVLAESAAKEREITDMQDMYERSMVQLEDDLKITQSDNINLQEELEDTKDELARSQRASTNEKMFGEAETRELRAKLQLQESIIDDSQRNIRNLENEVDNLNLKNRLLQNGLAKAEEEIRALTQRTSLADDYERQTRRLREDIAILTGKRNYLMTTKDTYSSYSLPPPSEYANGYTASQSEIARLRVRASMADEYEREVRRLKSEIAILRGTRYHGDVTDSVSSYRYLPRAGSPLAPDDVTQRVRQQNLIGRFNDMFSQDRVDAMDILRRYSDDHENNQRIVFITMQEAFACAKVAFRDFKMKVRSNLAATHVGPETLEEAVQDYINRNTDLYDLPALVSDVMRALNRSPKIFLPPEASYALIQSFIREACKLTWQMSALAHCLDIAVATDAELFDEYKYRRSYDSEYTAPLVNHHVWPCLMQGIKVIMKGECVTRRGASLNLLYTPADVQKMRLRSQSVSTCTCTCDRPLTPPTVICRPKSCLRFIPLSTSSPRRSISPSRSRPLSPSRPRSRSPSPRRIGSPDLGSSFSASVSGRSSPSGFRSSSRSSMRSTSPTRPYTASTTLSNY